MANVIKLRKGLDIHLKGAAKTEKAAIGDSRFYGIVPEAFVGVTPKLVVHEGDVVKAGDALFVNKAYPTVRFSSPASGTVVAVERGERRKVLNIKIKADEEQQFTDYGVKDVASLTADDVVKDLCEAGLFGLVNQLPYAISTQPDAKPKAIFVSAFRDMPLSGDFEYELQGNETAFQTGLSALSRIARVHLGVSTGQKSKALLNAKDVEVHLFDGPCPAGNATVQINHIAPVNKGETAWYVDPSAVIMFGRLFLTGHVDMTRTVAVAGSMITTPLYVDAKIGTPLSDILEGNLVKTDHVRILNGNPLTGVRSSLDGYLGAHTSEVTVIPEGDNVHEMLGWIRPRLNQYSVSRSYFSWLMKKDREYTFDARIKGGERHMIMSGEYDRVLPMDIMGEYLIKSIIAGDIDKQEQLGIYEVAPEDFAVAEFVDSSKLELQKIVRTGLDILRKENA